MRDKGERLEQFDESGDFRRCEECADPLVLIAAILVQSLARELHLDFDSALERAIEFADAASSPQVAGAAVVISSIGNGTFPPPIQSGPTSVAYGAQFIGNGAAKAISNSTGDHPNKIVGQLKAKIARNENSVQFLNPEHASAAISKLAEDIEVGKIRTEATYKIAYLFNETSNMLYQTAISHPGYSESAPEPRLFGAASLLVTATSLVQGAYNLVRYGNPYAAAALLRQIVEVQYVLWRFKEDPSSIEVWLNSDRLERSTNWKPSNTYKDPENDYRFTDYSAHCELGGHPTPMGTKIAAGAATDVSSALILGETIGHARSCWNHLVEIVETTQREMGSQIDNAQFKESKLAIETVLENWRTTDPLFMATGVFSDPLGR